MLFRSHALPKAKAPFQQNISSYTKENQEKKYLDNDQINLRKKFFFFTCWEPWVPNHQCVTGKAHCIEIFSDEEKETSIVVAEGGALPTGDVVKAFAPMGGTIVALRGVPKSLTLRVAGTILGQRVSVLVDNGATHNFIDT